jgi:serine/threonine protein kinase
LIEVNQAMDQHQIETIDTPEPNRFSADTTADDSLSSREVVSKFRYLRKIAEGGLGKVWLAHDEKLKRNVAVKELRENVLESPLAWSRFRREAEITGLLEHPNVVPLYQFGEDQASGKPFYTMRFVGKRTLANAIEEHRDRVDAGESLELGLHRLLTAFLGVCQAIAYAHSRGVIHRDLKPENVALDSFGQVIVLDWGIAKLMEESEIANQMTTAQELSDSALCHTREGAVVGTPLYMAPEQAMGCVDDVDHRTDIYGLGAVLFSILTGVAPHAKSVSETDAARVDDVLKIIASGETPRPSDHDSTISFELETICMKAMANKPHLRYESVEQFAEAVERWMAGQSSKKADYEAIRTEGRELKASLQVGVETLERNVQFMSRLPPIPQLVSLDKEDEIKAWRDRLATIFQGLLEANMMYRTAVFCRVDGDEVAEIVRVERHGHQGSRVRVIPKSKLRTFSACKFASQLARENPDEIITALVLNPLSDEKRRDYIGLVSGVPIYNADSEEPYGVLMIDCDLGRMLRQQLVRSFKASEVVVAGGGAVLIHRRSGRLVEETQNMPTQDVIPHFRQTVDSLANQSESLDEQDSEVYGVRLPFGVNDGIQILLRRGRP